MANERMINTISCGVVFVEGQGNYAIPFDEKQYTIAKIQEGVDRIAAYEPASNISVSYSGTSVQLQQFNMWKGSSFERLPMSYYKGFDAALWNKLSTKLFFFSNGEYVSIDPNNGMKMDAGYPKTIQSINANIPQNFLDGIDAAMWNHNNDRVLLFKGSEVLSLNPNNGWSIDSSFPMLISDLMPGLSGGFTNGIDAAVWTKTNEVLLFNKEKYVSINPLNSWQINAGYPKLIDGNLRGLGSSFKQGIDAAFMNDIDDKVYVFKRQPKVGNFFRLDPNTWRTDTNDAINTGLGWGFEAVWRDKAQQELGYPKGKNAATDLSNDIQARVGAQFGFIVFVTKFPTAWHGYVNGKKMIIQKSGADRRAARFENWPNLHKVIAHEAGHIFGAADEYGSNSCSKKQGRFIRTTNGNSLTCSPPIIPCIMKNSSENSICDFSRKSIGWWAFLEGIDTSFYHPHDEQHYLFSKDYFIRYSRNLSMQSDYAQHVSDLWPGINIDLSDGFDASCWNTNTDELFLFKGDQLIKITTTNGWNPDAGYPMPISSSLRLPQNFLNGVDAAMWNGIDTRILLFKRNQLVQVDPTSGTAMSGTLQPIDQFFQGLPSSFSQGIDSALWSEVNNCVYLFKNGTYVKVDPHNNWTVRPNYPKWIDGNWDMAFPKVS